MTSTTRSPAARACASAAYASGATTPSCVTKLDAAIHAGHGKTTLGELNLETTVVRNYFAWAGGRAQ